jgi:H+/Cl- antiporter ClcA
MALLKLAAPAAVVGVLSSLVLIGVSEVADKLQHLLWNDAPEWLSVSGSSDGWIVLVLTLTGLAVGLVVWKVPGHAGPDPATTDLVAAPLALQVLPGLLLALILMLAGGVSLGPENPIMAINSGLVVALGTKLIPAIEVPIWMGLGSSGMIGAMFGTPVAAALVLSESAPGDSSRPLWDRMFAPLVAAGAGAFTTRLLSGPLVMAISVPEYPGSGSAIG